MNYEIIRSSGEYPELSDYLLFEDGITTFKRVRDYLDDDNNKELNPEGVKYESMPGAINKEIAKLEGKGYTSVSFK